MKKRFLFLSWKRAHAAHHIFICSHFVFLIK
jgi:hypothetical protein